MTGNPVNVYYSVCVRWCCLSRCLMSVISVLLSLILCCCIACKADLQSMCIVMFPWPLEIVCLSVSLIAASSVYIVEALSVTLQQLV